MVVVDGEAGAAYDEVLPYTSRIVFDSPTSFHYIAVRGTRWLLVDERL
jgi:hypothetical protein